MLAVTLAAGSCADRAPCPSIAGTPADMTTAPGHYPGYDVVADPDLVAAVIGTGTITDHTVIAEAEHELWAALWAVPSISSSWTEPSADWGFAFYDWGDVDAAIELTGRWMRDHDLAFRVVIDVESPACAN